MFFGTGVVDWSDCSRINRAAGLSIGVFHHHLPGSSVTLFGRTESGRECHLLRRKVDIVLAQVSLRPGMSSGLSRDDNAVIVGITRTRPA